MKSISQTAARFGLALSLALLIGVGVTFGASRLVPDLVSGTGLDVWNVPQLLLEQTRQEHHSQQLHDEIQRTAVLCTEKEAIALQVLGGDLTYEAGLDLFRELLAGNETAQRWLQTALPDLEPEEQARQNFDIYLNTVATDLMVPGV